MPKKAKKKPKRKLSKNSINNLRPQWTPEQAAIATAAAAETHRINPTPKNLKAIKLMAMQGMAEGNIAYCLGTSPDVMTRWKKEHPEVVEALETGKAEGEHKCSTLIHQEVEKGNVSAAMFVLKTKYGWKEYNVIQLPKDDDSKTTAQQILSRLTDEELGQVKEIISRATGRVVIDGGCMGRGSAKTVK